MPGKGRVSTALHGCIDVSRLRIFYIESLLLLPLGGRETPSRWNYAECISFGPAELSVMAASFISCETTLVCKFAPALLSEPWGFCLSHSFCVW